MRYGQSVSMSSRSAGTVLAMSRSIVAFWKRQNARKRQVESQFSASFANQASPLKTVKDPPISDARSSFKIRMVSSCASRVDDDRKFQPRPIELFAEAAALELRIGMVVVIIEADLAVGHDLGLRANCRSSSPIVRDVFHLVGWTPIEAYTNG